MLQLAHRFLVGRQFDLVQENLFEQELGEFAGSVHCIGHFPQAFLMLLENWGKEEEHLG